MIAHWPLPVDAALHGPALDRQLILNLSIFASLFLLANVVLLTAVVLRRSAPPLAHRRWRYELLPLLLLAALFFTLAFRSTRLWAASRYSGAEPAAMQVEVTGMQFAWYFRYPGQDAAFGTTSPRLIEPGAGNPVGIDPADNSGKDDFVRSMLVIPAGKEIDLRLRALDVIHGFAAPSLRIKQNAIPGETFHVHFTATVPGDYPVLCTQVCGLGHYRMQAIVRVLPPDQFHQWLIAQQQAQTTRVQP